MIAIVNYGLGNLGSIKNMLKRVGHDSIITENPEDLDDASKIILPGVGAFDTGMRHLADHQWVDALHENVLIRKKPVLGICLGMQLMTRRSEEGILPGLGWMDAEVLKFRDPSLKIPHMGWNVVTPNRSDSILTNKEELELRYYFVHSYYVQLRNESLLLASTHYGITFASAFHKENIYGVQFHPEKSHTFGMRLIENFAKL